MHDDSHSPDCSCCLDHASAHQGVLDTLELMAGHPEASEDDIVQLLQARGYSAIAAEKLNAFVPSALAWIVLKRLGVKHLPTTSSPWMRRVRRSGFQWPTSTILPPR